MLDFELSEEQQMVKDAAREFCEKKLWPRAREIDEGGKIPDDIVKGLAEQGFLCITASEEFGGQGADPITAGLIAEEIGRGDISCATAVFYLVQASWGWVLDRYGTTDARASILPKAAEGKAFVGIATTEPDVGSDLANMRSIANKSGDTYVINGEKMYISGVREAMEQLPAGGSWVTLVKTEPERRTRGMSLLLVPLKTEAGTVKGITPTYVEDWGRTGFSTGGFAMVDVEVPATYLIGEENRGFYLAMQGFDYARVLIAAVCCGAAQRAMEYAIDYIKERKAFGQPIGKYEGIQFRLAEHWAKIDSVKQLTYKALWLLDRELKGETGLRFEVSKHIAEVKMLAPWFGFDAINDAIQWFGAFGYTKECPLDLGLRGIRSYPWAEGSTEVMKIIVARELLGKEYVAYR
jgi:acyl-CoA dehydrogenase